MKLRDMFENISCEIIQGDMETDVSGIAYDSRNVKDGEVFVCVSGFKVDGHSFIENALKKGAAAIVAEKEVEIPQGISLIRVKNSRAALAQMSANYFNKPSEKMTLIGVTGTNGKTSVTYIIKSVLDKTKHNVGIIGTIENKIGNEVIPTERTTPESFEVQKLFKQMKDADVNDVVMEVSSHALDLNRVDACDFDIGVFTNLTQDHLDYHITMENYRDAKAKLFEKAKKSVINIDDSYGEYMLKASKGEVITYGIEKNADICAENIKITADGVSFILVYGNSSYTVKLNIPGKFSIYNALGAFGACLFMGIPIEDIIEGIEGIEGVKGRFQVIKGKNNINAVVDYAHTPDGIENILNTAREFVKGRIITVFGCGGDRDKTKRPIMGEIAGRLSHFCIITSDNPRSENPEAILKDIEEGISKTQCSYTKVADRREAIFKAVEMAEENDLIVVAGKGHETYQIFSHRTIHFDDAEVIKEAFGEDN